MSISLNDPSPDSVRLKVCPFVQPRTTVGIYGPFWSDFLILICQPEMRL